MGVFLSCKQGKRARKKNQKTFEKPLDKQASICYNVDSQENQGETSGFEYTEETVMMTEWIKHLLICLIPIYNIIYLVKIVNGSSDSKPQLKEFAKLQLILIIAAVVIGIASGLIMNIVMSSMW